MCDTFCALPAVTRDHSVILAKSSDCEANEAQYIYKVPARKHVRGEEFKAAHIVIPQVAETYEAIVSRSFWTWGGELGINEHGLAVGNEAVFSNVVPRCDGLVVTDMLRLALERARTAPEAVEVIGALVHQYGQGGNCELRGNSHFDGSYIFADRSEAWVLETAGREWAARRIDAFDSISNVMTIGHEWDLCSLSDTREGIDFAGEYQDESRVRAGGARERRESSRSQLERCVGRITVQTMFHILRHHTADYHPGEGDTQLDICVHLGPSENRLWQATGAMVTEVDAQSEISWWTGTSSTCLSLFKPIFLGVELPDMGPWPDDHDEPRSLFWRHERLHRQAILDFDHLVPEIRQDFDIIEAEFLADAEAVKKGSAREKKAFTEHCFGIAREATDKWIGKLEARSWAYPATPFGDLWDRCNRAAAFSLSGNGAV
jgi:secernin